MTREYLEGETVSVTLVAAVVQRADSAGLFVKTEGGTELSFNFSDPRVVVSVGTPADGEPLPGEVWTDALDQVWFVRSKAGGRSGVEFIGADGMTQHPGHFSASWQDVHRQSGPIRRVHQSFEVTP